MAFQPPRPWDELIKQLLGNVQNSAQATERGLQARREERIIGEERAFQTQRDARQRQWQMDDAAQQRENELTDQANTIRLGQIQRLQAFMPYLDPSSDTYRLASRVLQALTSPSTLTGQVAWENALRAEVMVDGQLVAGSTVIADGERIMREVQRNENYLKVLAQGAIAFMQDGENSVEDRAAYANRILGSNLFSRDLEETLLAAIIPDQVARDRALDEGAIRDLDIAAKKVQVAHAAFTLKQEERLADLTYEEASQRVQMNAQTMFNNDVQMFLATGVMPTEQARVEELAISLNMTPEELSAEGQRRFASLQRREALDTQALELANRASKAQIDLVTMQQRQLELTYNRDLLYGAIAERKQLTDWAVAASTMGDTETLRMLQALADDPSYAETGLANLDFDGLMRVAEEIKGDGADIRADARLARETARRQTVLQARTDFDTAMDSIAHTFLEEDFTLDEQGNRPVDNAIQEYVDGFSAADLRRLGKTSEELVTDLKRRALRAHVVSERSEAAGLLDLMLANPVPEGEAERQAWANEVISLGQQADLPEAVIRGIVTGATDKAQRDLWRVMAETAEINQRADLLYQQSVGEWVDNQMKLAALSGTTEPLLVSRENYQVMIDHAATMVENARLVMTDDACALPGIDQQVLGIGVNRDEPVCAQAEDAYNLWTDRLAMLGMAVPVEDGFVLSFGAVEESGTYQDVMDMPGVDWEGFSKLPKDVQDTIAAFARTGGSAEDINLAIAYDQALTFEDERQRTAVENLRPVSDLDVNSDDWLALDFNTRTNRLANTREWGQLALDVIDGKVDLTDRETVLSLAQQFGWYKVPTDTTTREPTTPGSGLAMAARAWGEVLSAPFRNEAAAAAKQVDTDSFLVALRATVDSLRTQRDLPSSADAPQVAQFYRNPAEVQPRPQPEAESEPQMQWDTSSMPQPATAQGSGATAFAPMQRVPVGQATQPGTPFGSTSSQPGDPKQMQISATGLRNIAQHEGLRTKAYRDAAGNWTIGYGHTGSEVGPGMSITEERARQLLQADVQQAANAVKTNVQAPLTQAQFDALVSWVYNLGAGAFAQSGIPEALNQGNYQAAAEIMLQYNKARTGPNGELQTVPGLVNRRQSEARAFQAQAR